ncbi:MAG: hypothetical protein JWR35_2669 [Marmoricola sp.]|nr:hypothetical protein [Marmoricola sp.]
MSTASWRVPERTGVPSTSRHALTGIGISSAVAAVLTWSLHVVAGRELGVSGYARFMVVWGIFFTLTGILQGLQQEVTRSVSSALAGGTQGRRPIVGTLLIGASGFVVLVASSPLWAAPLLDHNWFGASVALGLGFAAYSIANLLSGGLAGMHSWRLYSLAILFEGVLRAVFVIGVLVVGTNEIGWALALLGASGVWVFLAADIGTRRAALAHGDQRSRVFVWMSAQAMVAAGCSALVVSGFPVLLAIFARSGSRNAAGVVLAALMVTRTPVLLFLNSYQGVLIAQLVTSRSPNRLLRRWLGLGLILAVPAALVSYFIGPPILRLVFGPAFDASGQLFAGLVVSTGTLALLTLTGWTVLARGQHAIFAAGWFVAAAVTSATLSLSLDLADRAPLALVVGPLAGAALHLRALAVRHEITDG